MQKDADKKKKGGAQKQSRAIAHELPEVHHGVRQNPAPHTGGPVSKTGVGLSGEVGLQHGQRQGRMQRETDDQDGVQVQGTHGNRSFPSGNAAGRGLLIYDSLPTIHLQAALSGRFPQSSRPREINGRTTLFPFARAPVTHPSCRMLLKMAPGSTFEKKNRWPPKNSARRTTDSMARFRLFLQISTLAAGG